MSARRLFGTDGVRGLAGVQLTAELALALGRAVAAELGAAVTERNFVVGRDPRISGPMLEAALTAGILAEGGNVLDAGMLPTPAVAFLVTDLNATAGAVISASHNPAPDNGIKFFGADGRKLGDEIEERIEQHASSGPNPAATRRFGERKTVPEAGLRYVEHALRALEGRTLGGMRVVLDCANGAASWTSPEAFSRAGADVVVINAEPDGLNINAGCGSMHPELVAAQVRSAGADLGLAHDGDADRVIAVDENGDVVDGDPMIAALALELKEQKRLPNNVVVGTVMANLGFRMAMAANGIDFVETPVGDRYVLEAMQKRGAAIGGEQSGHLVFSEFTTTGDGLVTALRLAGRMASTGRRLSELASVVRKFPQVLLNVRVERPGRVAESERVLVRVEEERRRLGEGGRVLVRPSGTEPVVRVMVEATDPDVARDTAERLAGLIAEELGPGQSEAAQDRVAST